MLLVYVVLVNLVTFCLFGLDKWKARHNQWRIPEDILLGLAIIGGSVGAWAGMSFFNHKTRHLKFRMGLPIIIIVQIVFIYVFCAEV